MKKNKLAPILITLVGLFVIAASVFLTLKFVGPQKEIPVTQTTQENLPKEESLVVISPSESESCSEEELLVISPFEPISDKVNEADKSETKGSNSAGERGIKDLKLVSKPKKLEYFIGDKINFYGIKAVVTYTDGKSEDVTKDLLFDSVNMNTAGEKTVVLYYLKNNHVYEKSLSFKINVRTPSIKITEGVSSLKVGATKRFKAYTNTNSSNIKWESSNTSVLKCDSNGNVKALKTGTAYIKAVLTYNGKVYKSSSYKVTVVSAAPKSNIVFSEDPFSETHVMLNESMTRYKISSLSGTVKSTYDIKYINFYATGYFMQDNGELEYCTYQFCMLDGYTISTKTFSFVDKGISIEFLMDKDYEIEIEVMDVKGYKKTSSIEMRLNKKDVEDYFGQ